MEQDKGNSQQPTAQQTNNIVAAAPQQQQTVIMAQSSSNNPLSILPQRNTQQQHKNSRQDQQLAHQTPVAKAHHQPLQPLSSLSGNKTAQSGAQPMSIVIENQSRARARQQQQNSRKGANGPLIPLFKKQATPGGYTHHQSQHASGGPIKANNLIHIQQSLNSNAGGPNGGSGHSKTRSFSKQAQPNQNGADLIDMSQQNGNQIDAFQQNLGGRAKSNSINNKTPEIKTHFRVKSDQQHAMHQPRLNQNGNGGFLGQQANMIIRGRSDKNTASHNAAMQQYASHELPSVMMKNQKQNQMTTASNANNREASERNRRRLSNGVQKNDSRSEQRSTPQVMINKADIHIQQQNPIKIRTGNTRDRSEDFTIRQNQKQNNSALGRFTQDSPLGIVAHQGKFIPKKGVSNSTSIPGSNGGNQQPQQQLFQRINHIPSSDDNVKNQPNPNRILKHQTGAQSRLEQHNNPLDQDLSNNVNFRSLEQPSQGQGQGNQGQSSEQRPQSRDRRSQKSRSLVARPLPKINEGQQQQAPASRGRQVAESLPRPASKPQQNQEQQKNEPDKSPTTATESPKKAQVPRDPNSVHNVVTKFSFATKGGIAAHNPYKVNQDAYLTNPHMLNLRHCHFFSVCDGHGHHGQEVSGLLKHRLPFQIEKYLKEGLAKHSMAQYPASNLITDNLTKAFADSNSEVFKMVSDVRFSGSTCTSIITYGRKVYCANVGDSRTILIRAAPNTPDGCTVKFSSRDHKPDDPEESKHIIANNGRIDSYRDQLGNQIGPMRVWLKNEDIPGLAMSRSFGDGMAARVGVNAIPEIEEFMLEAQDKILVLASDGVWEFLKDQDVANIVYPFYLQKNAEGAAENLVRAAFKRWKREESVIDDITCIIVFLDVK